MVEVVLEEDPVEAATLVALVEDLQMVEDLLEDGKKDIQESSVSCTSFFILILFCWTL